MSYTIPQILTIAKISQFLCKIEAAKSGLFPVKIPPNLDELIYMERMAVQYMYGINPSRESLTSAANYLYGLCRQNLKAINIMNGGGGGSVSPVTPSNPPTPYQFIVAASGNLLNNGDSTVTITSFIGYNLLFSRGGIPQSTVSTEPTYYSWDRNSGIFTVTPSVNTGELIQLFAI